MLATGPRAPHRDSPRGGLALLVIDMVNAFDFEGGDALREKARAMRPRILALRAAVDAASGNTIHVNDNFGEWHSEQARLVERARQGNRGGAADADGMIVPRETDFFVIKPQFSGFYATNLPVLLPKLGASRLILTGVSADICVLFTAADAHMRDYALWIPEDCIASTKDEAAAGALTIMRTALGAETAPTSALDISRWLGRLDAAGIR